MNKPKTATASKASVVNTIRVYVPSSRRPIAEKSVALAKAQLLAGGWSIRHITGGWIDPSGNPIIEPVDEHEYLVSTDKAQAVMKYLTALSEELLAAGEQAVLLVEVNSCGNTTTYTLS